MLENSYQIKYVDAKNDFTEREIQILSVSKKTRKISAYCLLRDDFRLFFVDQILEAVDLLTGEILSNKEFCEKIGIKSKRNKKEKTEYLNLNNLNGFYGINSKKEEEKKMLKIMKDLENDF